MAEDLQRDLLALETPIKGRVEAALKQVPHAHDLARLPVRSRVELRGLEQVEEEVVYVIYGGQTPRDQGMGSLILDQTWVIAVCLVNRRDPVAGVDLRAEAGPAMAAILSHLHGWTPAPGATPLIAQPSPAAVQDGKGYGYFPLAFACSVPFEADENDD